MEREKVETDVSDSISFTVMTKEEVEKIEQEEETNTCDDE